MLKSISTICAENNLRYYLCGGSLIGSVRHKGFIPWDDDIDIMMPREDYKKFLELADERLPDGIKIQNYTHFHYPQKPEMHHAQVIDLNTRIVRNWSNKKSEINLWIDLFPIDGMPKNILRRKLHYYHVMFWHVIMQLSWFDEIVNQSKPNRPFYEKAIIKFIKLTHLGKSWDTIKIIKKMDSILEKYSFDSSEYCCSLHGSYRQKEIHQRYLFDEVIELPFEDAKFKVPAEYDAILKQYYGNYMTPPETRAEKEDHHKIEIISLGKE